MKNRQTELKTLRRAFEAAESRFLNNPEIKKLPIEAQSAEWTKAVLKAFNRDDKPLEAELEKTINTAIFKQTNNQKAKQVA